MDYLSFFLKCFTTFFVIVDPPGNLPVFIALTQKLDRSIRERVSRRATAIALALMLAVMITGRAILDFFHISINSLRVAGGVLLFIVSVDILLGGTRREVYRKRAEESLDIDSIAVFPLALPLYTGPGAITAGIVIYSQATDVYSRLIVIASVIVVYALVRLSHTYSEPIIRLLGRSGADIVARLLAIFLAAIAVEFVFEGIKGEFFSV